MVDGLALVIEVLTTGKGQLVSSMYGPNSCRVLTSVKVQNDEADDPPSHLGLIEKKEKLYQRLTSAQRQC